MQGHVGHPTSDEPLPVVPPQPSAEAIPHCGSTCAIPTHNALLAPAMLCVLEDHDAGRRDGQYSSRLQDLDGIDRVAI